MHTSARTVVTHEAAKNSNSDRTRFFLTRQSSHTTFTSTHTFLSSSTRAASTSAGSTVDPLASAAGDFDTIMTPPRALRLAPSSQARLLLTREENAASLLGRLARRTGRCGARPVKHWTQDSQQPTTSRDARALTEHLMLQEMCGGSSNASFPH